MSPTISRTDATTLLTQRGNLLPLLQSAYTHRQHTWGNKVQVHIINNAQNGNCPEDCNYCAQAKTSEAGIEDYRMKPDEEILAEAKAAHDSGAHRYCMVFSGRGPTKKRINDFARIIKKIKDEIPIQTCLSAGLIDDTDAAVLKAAGLDRLNHNLNTSESNYPKICSSHTYEDRMNTLMAAQKAGLSLCSGIIVGMGETPEDIVDVALKLNEMNVKSIPVNFLLPIDGTPINKDHQLSPEYCLRILCVFRLLNPDAEIRIAAGREYHLRSLQPLALYPANSLFMEGYLNTTGTNPKDTIQMITDAGFEIESEVDIDTLLNTPTEGTLNDFSEIELKNTTQLRPTLN